MAIPKCPFCLSVILSKGYFNDYLRRYTTFLKAINNSDTRNIDIFINNYYYNSLGISKFISAKYNEGYLFFIDHDDNIIYLNFFKEFKKNIDVYFFELTIDDAKELNKNLYNHIVNYSLLK